MPPLSIDLFAQQEAAAAATVLGFMGLYVVCYFACIFGAIALKIGLIAFWVWMLVDCIQSEQKLPEPENQLTLWLLLIILLYPFGAMVYFFARKPYNKYPTGPHYQHPQHQSPFQNNKGLY